jgi:hypothetical protein
MSIKKTILKTSTVFTLMVTAATLTVSEDTDAAGTVTTTKDDCVTAWAILTPGDATGQEMVKNVVRWHRHWSPDGYELGVSQKFELHTFDKTFGGGNATVAHCGHGATCNELARVVAKAYPNAGSPVVYCVIEPPHILENPQTI